MDLAVTGLRIDDRYVMITELQKFAGVLEKWECLESFKAIETASIPVIKMVTFFTHSIGHKPPPTQRNRDAGSLYRSPNSLGAGQSECRHYVRRLSPSKNGKSIPLPKLFARPIRRGLEDPSRSLELPSGVLLREQLPLSERSSSAVETVLGNP